MSESLQQKRNQVIMHLKQLRSVLVAFSGGVDSAVMAALAYEALQDKAAAVTFDSSLMIPEEVEDARQVAKTIGIRHHVQALNELKIASIVPNPVDRCYHCKLHRFREAQKLAVKLKLAVVIDGTTVSDLGEYRPGLRAIKELEIISPLLEAGISKLESRQLARELELPVANKPSNSCLATRIPYGETLTEDRLARVAAAEKAIRDIADVSVIRVRDHGRLARIEVPSHQIQMLLQKSISDQIIKHLESLGYEFVTVDLKGYRFGSFDEE